MTLTAVIPSVDELVARVLNGDTAAFRLLYERYSRAMYNTALRITGNTADAEDVLQEAFTDVFFQLRSFANKSTFGAWIKQIVVFKSVNLLRKRKISFDPLESDTELPEAETAMEETEVHLTVDRIKQVMRSLPDGYRTILSLYLLEGYDHEEIADILQLAPSSVRTQYIRGKQKLLSQLKKEERHA